jgi:ATP/maltotriose-dependent transcriptional regulator MalT
MYGEYLSTRALALAVSGNQEEARVAARRARALTRAIDSAILCAAALAIVEAQAEPAKTDAVDELLRIAVQVNTWDGVVCAVRAYPPLLERLVARPEHHAQLRDVLVRSRDVALAKAAGLVTRATGSQGLLSSREREILDQVRQGRKNVEIATSLFIAPGTVKSHLDHIFDKLGVRSRTGAVLRYAEIENAGSGDVSGLAES